MLKTYYPMYQIALGIQERLETAQILRDSLSSTPGTAIYDDLLIAIQRESLAHGFTHTANLAKRVRDRGVPKNWRDLHSALTHLNDSLSHELESEAIFCISPERKNYFDRDDLFGLEVATAFPSCARDIKRAGSCYALEQEDACVHHLMLVLERGLHALAGKVGIAYQPDNWQKIINEITGKLNTLPHGHPDRAFYREVNAQFGFLKDAYRNHSEHARDDPYDMDKAHSILIHVRDFMQELEKGGLRE